MGCRDVPCVVTRVIIGQYVRYGAPGRVTVNAIPTPAQHWPDVMARRYDPYGYGSDCYRRCVHWSTPIVRSKRLTHPCTYRPVTHAAYEPPARG